MADLVAVGFPFLSRSHNTHPTRKPLPGGAGIIALAIHAGVWGRAPTEGTYNL